MNTKMISALITLTVLLFSLFALGCTADVASGYEVETEVETGAAPSDITPDQAEQVNRVGMSLSRALSNGKPTLILFTPVEMCQIHYCLQPAQVAHQIEQYYPGQVNLVVAPVYAVDTPEKPRFPVIDWGVYMVDPFANWVPALEQTVFGWSPNTAEVVLVTTDGAVIARSVGHLYTEVLDVHLEQLAMSE